MEKGTTVLRLEGLRCAAGGRVLLDAVHLNVAAGESVAVTGPSGSGKTTLLMCALGLVPPDSGTVQVAGEDLGRLSFRRLAAHRRRNIGVVFQFGELLPELSPVENVALPALLAGEPHRAAYREAAGLLESMRVPVDATRTALLSGGERQRTAVARALIGGPALLLADEPTGALDREAGAMVADLLFSLPLTRACALVVVTHDQAIAERADRRLRLEGGRLVESGAVAP
ncbi:ABC transporter ATP-binding protein [Actinomadura sp. 9N407]|uniref:ABC transporter ATP-binding protein n=1 Tax=Actinomadura sp. 9N407 TaxID=3375154 RepID=UPI0037BC742D